MQRTLTISFSLHILILLMIILQYNPGASHTTTPGDSDHNAINAYFVSTNETMASQHHSLPDKTGITLRRLKSTKARQLQSQAASKGVMSNDLLALLHNAIQKQQTYPESALEMGREGRTTVNFRLFPDGHIENVSILRASGTQILDTAALLAVNSAAPFHGVEKFISTPGDYSIDVVFED